MVFNAISYYMLTEDGEHLEGKDWTGLLGFDGDPAEADFQRIDAALESYYPQMERDLMTLISCPSVQGEPAWRAPFGAGVREALDFTLGVAATLGFRVDDLDGYVGLADLEGYDEEQVGVLCHLDVVPAAAEDWTVCSPFDPVVKDGRIYGRGALDDKGPTIAALYGAAALLDFGIPLSKTVRFILGCNEESGMECVKYYLSKFDPPALGFTPDGRFPLVNGEKGICHFALTADWPADDSPGRLLSIKAGTAPNIVPARAEAVFGSSADLRFHGEEGVTISEREGRIVVTACGKAAHGSLPEQGDNALVKLVGFLAGQSFAPAGAAAYIKRLSQLLADEKYGSGLGLAEDDGLSPLTCSPNLLALDGSGATLTCDCRFPVRSKSRRLLEKLEKLAEEEGWQLSVPTLHEPLYMPSDQLLPRELLAAYREVSGDDREPLVMGCGTYAKAFSNFLAFGAEAADSPGLAHQADEYFSSEDLLLCAKVYARAIYRLAK